MSRSPSFSRHATRRRGRDDDGADERELTFFPSSLSLTSRRFNITNDFTPEEEAQIKKENEWAEEYVPFPLRSRDLSLNLAPCSR